MSDQIGLWQDPEIQLSQDQLKRADTFRDWLRSTNIPVALFLADANANDTGAKFADAQMTWLQRKIVDESTSLSSAHRDLQILGKVVARWNSRTGTKILQPRLTQVFTFPANPFTQGVGGTLSLRDSLLRVQTWLKCEKNWIEECSGVAPLELIVFSAMLHGGLLHSSSIVRFVHALFSPDDAIGFTSLGVYVDLALPWRGLPEMEQRKWYPDPQTAAMLRAHATIPGLKQTFGTKWNGRDLNGISDTYINSRVFQKIRERMRRAKIEKGLLPQSLTQLLDVLVVSAYVELPAVLVEYASRRVVSHSLKPAVLKRIYRQAQENVETLESDDSSEGNSSAGEEEVTDVADNQEDIEPAGLIALRKALRKDSEAKSRLAELVGNAGTIEQSATQEFWTILADFALYLLTDRRIQRFGKSSKKLLQPSGAKKYSLIVGRRLGRQLGAENLLTFGPLNLETAYTKVFERLLEQDTSIRLRRTVSTALREFQRYLEDKHKLPAIDKDVLGLEGGLLPVDSNIITLEEFQSARSYIQKLKQRKLKQGKLAEARILDAADAMMILGFRCGTRRMEAHGLKMADLVEQGTPWLIIRPSDERRLKTPNATRQLPLQALVPRVELHALLKWKESRERQAASREANLFGGIKELGYEECIHIDRLISVIHDALHHATGDEFVHFHQLRHSCATWVFLRLMLSDLPTIPVLFPHLTATTAWLKKSRRFRILLYGRGTPTRQHALAVASLLGHSGYRVTLENYVHCMDWLLPLFLEQSDFLGIPTTRRIVAASGFDKSTVYEWEQQRKQATTDEEKTTTDEEKTTTDEEPLDGEVERQMSAGAAVELFKKRFPHLSSRFETWSEQGHDGNPDVQSWLDQAWDVLRHGGQLDVSAADSRSDLRTTELILDRAEKIAKILIPRGRKTPRHKFVEIDDPLTPGKRRVIPPRPDDLGDVEVLIGKLQARVDANSPQVKKILGYYVSNIWQNGTLLPFRDPEWPQPAIDYLEFLHSLEIEYSDIWLGSYHELKRSRWRRRWIEVFEEKLHHRFEIHNVKSRFKRDKTDSKQSASTSKMLLIEPIVGREKPGKSTAFRFMMVMAAIYFGYEE